MDHLLKGLLDKLSSRKRNEMAHFEKYKEEELNDSILISSGKIMEIDYLASELKALIKKESKQKRY